MALSPIHIDDEDLRRWSMEPDMVFAVAQWWARHGPRGRGWVPCHLGRWFGRNMRHVIRTRRGAMLAVNPSELDYFTAICARGGELNSYIARACIDFLNSDAVFYDIGAHVGLMSMEVAKAFDGALRVFAFEPQPLLARTAAMSAALNAFRNVLVYQTVLGSGGG